MRARPTIVVGASILALGACAAGWEHPTVPRERWTADEHSCVQEADAEIERLTRGERLSRGDATLSRDTSYDQSMARLEIGRLQRSLIERCMTGRGYVRGTGR